MTVIAWDGKTLAADRLTNCQGVRMSVTKIHRLDGMLVGGAGELDMILEVVEWIRAGRNPATFPAAQRTRDDNQAVLLVEQDWSRGGAPVVRLYTRAPVAAPYESPFVAVGSGAVIAMTAMHLGKTAVEAAKLACELNQDCGGGIDALSFG